MLIISILLSGVNWIQTVTIVWSETSLFLGGREMFAAVPDEQQLHSPRSLFSLCSRTVAGKYGNDDKSCDNRDSCRAFRDPRFHFR